MILNNAYESFVNRELIKLKRAQENIIKILHCIKINNNNGDKVDK